MSCINSHSILIKSDIRDVFNEVVSWGEAGWWPKCSFMRFIRLTPQSDIIEGTIYKQKVTLPFGPSWDTEVTKIENDHLIERKFLNGLFIGGEEVSVLQNSDTVEVNYCMTYKIRGFINYILWNLFFRRLHDYNIKLILKSLKRYLEELH